MIVLRYIQVGDTLTHTRPGGMIAEHRYVGPGPNGCLSGTATLETANAGGKYGVRCYSERGRADDIEPANVTHINRVPVAAIEEQAVPWPQNTLPAQMPGDPPWFERGNPWPLLDQIVEGRWPAGGGQYSYGFLKLQRLRGIMGETGTWRDLEGNIVPFAPPFWRPVV